MRMTSQRCPLSQFRGPLEQGKTVAGGTRAPGTVQPTSYFRKVEVERSPAHVVGQLLSQYSGRVS